MDRFKFRLPIKCNNCGFKSFQFFFWNGQSFMEDGYQKCNCEKPAFEVVGELQQCVGSKDDLNKPIYEEDIIEWDDGYEEWDCDLGKYVFIECIKRGTIQRMCGDSGGCKNVVYTRRKRINRAHIVGNTHEGIK